MTGARVLVVDDEPQILRALQTNLRGAGYDVETAATAEQALAAAAVNPPAAVILDLILPDRNGTEVTRELRRWSAVPILVLSAVGDEREKVAALDAGADDYVTKPFGMEELLARLRAALRRAVPGGEPVLRVGEVEVDLEKRSVAVAGRSVQLTPNEFDLLSLFVPTRASSSRIGRSCVRSGDRPTARNRTTCTSTSRSCGARSSPTQPGRAPCSRSPAPATGSSIRNLELFLSRARRTLSPA